MENKIRLSEQVATTRIITKLPESKDPVICISWIKEYEGARFNEDLIDKYQKDKYVINIFPVNDHGKLMNLMLINVEDQQVQRLYKNLAYDDQKFRWWMEYTSQNKRIEKYKFCHIYNDFEKHRVIKTNQSRRNFVLDVIKITVLDSNRLPF